MKAPSKRSGLLSFMDAAYHGADIVPLISMENDIKLEAPWAQVKEQLKEINASLTDEDLAYEPGKADELLQRLARKLHKDTGAVRDWIESVSFNKGKAS